ncbi:MAG: Hpt domain-containing protein [Nitrospiraceae bacterium]
MSYPRTAQADTAPTVSTENTQPIHVTIDEALEELIPTFLANRRKDVETLRQALATSDFRSIQLLGHRLRGDAGGYGFEAMGEMGTKLEAAAERQDCEAIERQIALFVDYLNRVRITYQA